MTDGRVVGGRYKLLAEVGSGAMASVWRAIDLTSGSTVAVKLMHGHLLSDRTQLERFRREAAATRRLTSPFTVRLFEDGIDAGQPFLVMEFVEEGTLADELRLGRIETPRALRIARQLALALAEAHANGVVHRDIKPGNVLITSEGDAKLADFGIAWLLGSASYTVPGTFLGAIRYAAPESLEGEAGPPSDLYSLGVLLFQMLTGRLPFLADSTAGAVQQQHIALPPLELLAPQDHAVRPILERLLQKRPEDRYPDAPALVRTLAGEDPTVICEPPDAPAPPVAESWRPKRRYLVGAASILAPAAIAIGIMFFGGGRDAFSFGGGGSPPGSEGSGPEASPTFTSAERTFLAVASAPTNTPSPVAQLTAEVSTVPSQPAPAGDDAASGPPPTQSVPPTAAPSLTQTVLVPIPPAQACSGSDFDTDGVCDSRDLCLGTLSGRQVDGNGCAQYQVDFDEDNVCDPGAKSTGPQNCGSSDLCLGTLAGRQADGNGCAQYQVDFDEDNVCDPGAKSAGPEGCQNSDLCLGTLSGRQVDGNGCAQYQVDFDEDNVCDPGAKSTGPKGCTGIDQCPGTLAGKPVDSNGCADYQ